MTPRSPRTGEIGREITDAYETAVARGESVLPVMQKYGLTVAQADALRRQMDKAATE